MLIWDGGNNDLPFFAPDLVVVVAEVGAPTLDEVLAPVVAAARERAPEA